VEDIKGYSEVAEVFLVSFVPVFHELFWAFSRFLSFDEDWCSVIVGCANVYGVVAFESAVSYKYVGWKICGGNVS